MQLEINTAGGDLENLTRAVFCNCVVASRSTQATFNTGLVCVVASGRSLCKPRYHEQDRCSHQQEYSFHGILLRFSPCGGQRFHLGFDFAVGPYAEHSRVVHRLSCGLGTWSIRSGTAQNLSGMELIVCSQPLTFDWDSIHRQRSDVRSVILLFRHATLAKAKGILIAPPCYRQQ